MSRQIAVRLPDELASFVDAQVADGRAASRAAVVVKALKREQRRAMAERDAQIYATTEDDGDMQALAEWAARQPLDLD